MKTYKVEAFDVYGKMIAANTLPLPDPDIGEAFIPDSAVSDFYSRMSRGEAMDLNEMPCYVLLRVEHHYPRMLIMRDKIDVIGAKLDEIMAFMKVVEMKKASLCPHGFEDWGECPTCGH